MPDLQAIVDAFVDALEARKAYRDSERLRERVFPFSFKDMFGEVERDMELTKKVDEAWEALYAARTRK